MTIEEIELKTLKRIFNQWSEDKFHFAWKTKIIYSQGKYVYLDGKYIKAPRMTINSGAIQDMKVYQGINIVDEFTYMLCKYPAFQEISFESIREYANNACILLNK